MTQEVSFIPEGHGKLVCPCGGTVFAGKVPGSGDALMHSDPVCEDFMGREVGEYLAWMRRRTELDLLSMMEFLPDGGGVVIRYQGRAMKFALSPKSLGDLRTCLKASDIDYEPKDLLLELRIECTPITDVQA